MTADWLLLEHFFCHTQALTPLPSGPMTSQLMYAFHYLCVAALSGIITAVYKFTEKSELDTLNRLFYFRSSPGSQRSHNFNLRSEFR